MAPQRTAVVPAFGLRIERKVARNWFIGGMLGGGFPAWYGKAEATASVDLEHAFAQPQCDVVYEGPGHIGTTECRGARWAMVFGVDAGVGLLYFDAPPETSPSSDALVYWGPLARARVQLHILDVLPNSRAVGVAIGASVAATSARYMSTAEGRGVRLEPELEIALTTRL